ncbi:hypothetical protein ACQ33O_04260 [Ferruginibacter sp. SUN002]|uniref:hypothetical protein n=1 Tax=Ferruginibacter sp. SUN002 TaxID=2937789 RepID=UPI003D36BA14
MAKYLSLFIIALGFQLTAFSQENSPYSRYGLGDQAPDHNIVTRGMGGISAAYVSPRYDSARNGKNTQVINMNAQSINYINPATYSNFYRNTIFDLGAEVGSRKLKSINPVKNFTSTNALFSYMQLGIPIKMKKANKKDIFLGVNIGLKPDTRVNYKLARFKREVDSLVIFEEGSGGTNEAFTGVGLSIKNFSIGFNIGYKFGTKDSSSQITFLNDTIAYYESNASTKTNFGGLLFNAGIQYKFKLKDSSEFRIGAYGSLKQKYSASKDVIRETVSYDADGASTRIDSVYENNIRGNVVYPSNFGVGVTLQKQHWLFGADFEMTNWKEFRFYDKADFTDNSWKLRVGTEYYPATNKTPLKKYFNFVRYRAGFYYGPNAVNLTTVPEYAFTFGAGFPLKLRRGFYDDQNSMLNTAIEIGSRGDNKSNLKENFFRVSFGVSLSDLWFRRYKYD